METSSWNGEVELRFGVGDTVKVRDSTCTGRVAAMFFDKWELVCSIEWEENSSYAIKIFGSYVPYSKLEAL